MRVRYRTECKSLNDNVLFVYGGIMKELLEKILNYTKCMSNKCYFKAMFAKVFVSCIIHQTPTIYVFKA